LAQKVNWEDNVKGLATQLSGCDMLAPRNREPKTGSGQRPGATGRGNRRLEPIIV